MISINDNDIQYAEKILFGRTVLFDDERKEFIKNLKTIDLQAVPGSGKTTALLAKLLIIEKHLPFSDGSGILVLSHTNTAIDEIKERIGKYCPKLFSYPNFVGTIQSFVDNFLAIPFYVNEFKSKPYRIDDEIYYEKTSIIYNSLKYSTKQYLEKNKGRNNIGHDFFVKIKVDADKNLLRELNGPIFLKNTSSSNSYKDILEKKEIVMKEWGVLHYDDAYFLAEQYLIKFPHIKNLLQKRFRYVFVDEMQDMDIHQYELLEKIFYDNGNSNSVYQRIGDKNQAIFNEVKIIDIWQPRNEILINGSHRLTPQIVNIVKHLTLTPNEIIGLNKNSDGREIQINPHIIVYDDKSITRVVHKFAEIIKDLQDEDKIPKNPKHKFMAIGWIKGPREDGKITISSYWNNYFISQKKKSIDYKALKDYLLFNSEGKKTLGLIRKNILNALLKIMRLEKINDEKGKNYTQRKFLSYLKNNKIDEYEKFKLKIYQWSIGIIKGEYDNVYNSIKEYIPEFLGYFEKAINFSSNFINEDGEITIEETEVIEQSNKYKSGNIEIEIGTIHSAKGQTHTATLYLETYYYGKYESEYLFDAILGNDFQPGQVHQKEAMKIAYVGFSRPTHLLCIAIHKDRYNSILTDINNEIWNIIKIF